MSIVFNQKIYDAKAIKSAVAMYGELATFKVKKKGSYFEVALSPTGKYDIKMLEDEFANYVLFVRSKSV